MSEQRISLRDVDERAYKAVGSMSMYVAKSGLDKALVTMIEIRASQVNNCAWCLDMHTEEARKAGVDQRKLDLLAAWSEAPAVFTSRERAAMALTEQVTLIANGGVSDDVWEMVTTEFDDREIVSLIMTISTINIYNRMNVAAHTTVGPERLVPNW